MKNLIKTGMAMLVIAVILIAVSALFMRAHAASDIVTENRTIDDKVVAIVMNGSVDLNLKQAKAASLVLRGSANNLAHIITRVEGNTLLIDTRGFILSVNQPLIAEISLPNLDKLQLNGSGDANVKGFNGKRLDAILRGSGDLQLEANYQQIFTTVRGSGNANISSDRSDYIEVAGVGSGEISLKGQSAQLVAKMRGSGDLNASTFKADLAIVQASGSADVKLWVSNEVRLSLSGSGDATIAGNPPKRMIEQSGSGHVHWQ